MTQHSGSSRTQLVPERMALHVVEALRGGAIGILSVREDGLSLAYASSRVCAQC